MDQELVKTSKKQRIIISVIAILMLGSFIASYAAIVAAGGNSGAALTGSDLIAKYEAEYNEKLAEFQNATANDFNEFVQFKNHITAFNETAANSNGLNYVDLKVGDGRELTDGDDDYSAYYVGFCADESVFDSTLNSTSEPTAFSGILNVKGMSLIEGWQIGVIGMKLGGIREMTIPGELAYKDAMEICGGLNKPLKFIIMAIENSGDKAKVAEEFTLAQTKYRYAQSGIDYDAMMGK